MLILKLFVFSFHELVFIRLLLQARVNIVEVSLHLLELLEVNVAFLSDCAVALLQLFILFLGNHYVSLSSIL